jgi:hypothetical protein
MGGAVSIKQVINRITDALYDILSGVHYAVCQVPYRIEYAHNSDYG